MAYEQYTEQQRGLNDLEASVLNARLKMRSAISQFNAYYTNLTNIPANNAELLAGIASSGDAELIAQRNKINTDYTDILAELDYTDVDFPKTILETLNRATF